MVNVPRAPKVNAALARNVPLARTAPKAPLAPTSAPNANVANALTARTTMPKAANARNASATLTARAALVVVRKCPSLVAVPATGATKMTRLNST
ncbi:hypothetical protein DYB32_010325 [Aphanomyces invadans]|uniref:Uncharacterized protein n=1 Tax=Aphanomyces invadans TaxID=157072 RepID=A0A3R7A4T8_9STRA|nr:hypothetical protein DYB32_010325 [Aphanomyces invadans]